MQDDMKSKAQLIEELRQLRTEAAASTNKSAEQALSQDIQAMAAHMVEMGLWKDIPGNLAAYLDNRFIDQAMDKSAP